MRRIHLAALGAALVVGIGSTATAQATPGVRHQGRGADSTQGGHAQMRARMDSALFRGITLSEAQRSQIATIRGKYHTQMTALRDRGRAAGQGDVQRQRPDSATRAQARSLMQQQQAEVRGVLTPDQQKLYDRNVADMRSRGHGQGGRWKGHADSSKTRGGR